MIERDGTRWIRLIPLEERNWPAMFMTALVLAMTAFAAYILWMMVATSAAALWVWLTAIVMTAASLVSVIGLISGDVAWLLMAILISRQR